MIDFDKKVNRSGTGAVKWDWYKDRDILPMWVADMDFTSPPAVIEALKQRAEHGVFGYTWHTRELVDVIIERLHRLYQWQVQPEWIVWLSGLVSGLNVTCRAIGEHGDSVVTTIPVYPPFLSAPQNQDRTLATFMMAKNNGDWQFDLDAFEKAISPTSCLFILCNPHNPLGRIFTRNELLNVAEVCEKHDLIICSDEIHCDLLLDRDKSHIPTATLAPEIAERTITLMAPSKTFNIAGLGLSFAIISNEGLRKKFERAKQGIVPYPNLFGYTAALAAYKEGHVWLQQVLDYLRENARIVYERINGLSGLFTTPVEATYLAWIDARHLPIENAHKFFENAGVGLSDGREFNGPGYLRLNFGCPRRMLADALDRMSDAIQRLESA
ncbi:putative C-S lyase [candidate division KSB1 bacterium]|nr:PatB family C-S lyase [candidate division KSB1 bacterium]RQW05557.1 MAG: putative C-S lyase [candidate division KSB1 bacterium]